MRNIITTLALLGLSLNLSATQYLPASTELITVRGALYPTMNGVFLEFRRFPVNFKKLKSTQLGFNIKKAETTSGVSLLFKSNSKKITLEFKIDEEHENRGSDFALFINENMNKTWTFNKKQAIKINISNPSGERQDFRLVLPSFSNPMLKGITIDDGASLKPNNLNPKKKYLAIGDSITHGVGQDSKTYKTYGFQLAQMLDLQFYNLAVGGGKISPAVSEILPEFKNVRLITILIGYNDWHHQGKTLEEFELAYNNFLNKARASYPHAKIFCISLLYTKTEKSKRTGLEADAYRTLLEQLVNRRTKDGDKHLYFIPGDSISSSKNLRPDSSDPVHLGIEGAKMFANELNKIIAPKLSN